jgi:glutamine amidotransferase
MNLRERGWSDWLIAASKNQTPILGLCLGMQLLCEGSAEGVHDGLGIIPGKFVRFETPGDGGQRLKVPHMGWNFVRFDHNRAPWSGDPSQPKRFYFVHSFHLPGEAADFAVGWTEYGKPFTSAIAMNRVIGLQFHPEKSHRFGSELLRGIVDWARA